MPRSLKLLILCLLVVATTTIVSVFLDGAWAYAVSACAVFAMLTVGTPLVLVSRPHASGSPAGARV